MFVRLYFILLLVVDENQLVMSEFKVAHASESSQRIDSCKTRDLTLVVHHYL